MDTCICMAESLCRPSETITTLFVNQLYLNTKKKKIKKRYLPSSGAQREQGVDPRRRRIGAGENRGCRLRGVASGRGEGVSLNSPNHKRGLSLRLEGMGCGDPVGSAPQEGKVLGANPLSWALGGSLDASSPQRNSSRAEISGVVQGADNAGPRQGVVTGEGGVI